MDVFPAFRRRDVTGRGRYMRLENDSDSASQHSGSSRNSSLTSRRHDNSVILCDRCWTRHERQPATKRCLECKQNLCIICARCDEIRRPWWLPTLLVQCWRFFFTKAFIPHSFVELYDDDNTKTRHWVHTQEASHIQPIPRVTRNSLRSNKSTRSSSQGRTHDNDVVRERDRKRQPTHNPQNESFARSRSFEGFKERRRVKHRRSKSVDKIRENQRRADRREALWNNYHERAESYENNWDDESIMSSEIFLRRKVMKGKDIDIELTAEDVKVTVNGAGRAVDENSNKEDNDKVNCAVQKTKQKKGSKKAAPEPYTEQIFTDVPIWFKRSSAHKKKPVSSNDKRNRISNEAAQHSRNKQNINYSSYDYRGYQNKHPCDLSSQSKTSLNSNVSKSSNISCGNPYSEKQNDHVRNHWRKTKAHDNLPEEEKQCPDENLGFNISTSYIVEEPPDPCPICLEDLPKCEARILRCSHQIHTNCLKDLLFSTDLDFGIRCPVCKQTTTVQNYYAPKDLWYRELPVSTNV